MAAESMHLKIFLPFEVFTDVADISRIVAETLSGSFGLLPLRLDCVGVLEPGILTYQSKGKDEEFIAVDQGVLVKTGLDVLISVRRAVAGKDLTQLRDLVEKEFLTLDEDEKSTRTVMAKLEIGLVRRLAAITS